MIYNLTLETPSIDVTLKIMSSYHWLHVYYYYYCYFGLVLYTSSFPNSLSDWATLVRWSVSRFHSSTQQVGRWYSTRFITIILFKNKGIFCDSVSLCAAFLMEQLHVALKPVMEVPLLLTRNEVRTHFPAFSIQLAVSLREYEILSFNKKMSPVEFVGYKCLHTHYEIL